MRTSYNEHVIGQPIPAPVADVEVREVVAEQASAPKGRKGDTTPDEQKEQS